MPENHEERDASKRRSGASEAGRFGKPGEFGDRDDFDDEDDEDVEENPEPGGPGRDWPTSGYFPAGYPQLPGAKREGRRRGWTFALTAVVAAAIAFGVMDIAIHDVSGNPAASAAPSASAPGADGGQLAPQGGGAPSLPSGATMHVLIAGPVTAVNASSITVGSGSRAVTATVTGTTKVTGKVTSVNGIKVGDAVSASVTGADGKLTADSIQDPASLPSGLGL